MSTPIGVNDLPQYSPWPARLLGLKPWTQPDRVLEKIEQEYNEDKYDSCLSFYRDANEPVSPEAVKQHEFNRRMSEQMCISQGEKLYLTTVEDARNRYYSMLKKAMASAVRDCATVVELGCGYGFNLWKLNQAFPEQTFLGGEYADNAVKLAGHLFDGNPDISVAHFNFYDSLTYELLQKAEPPVVVFTSHAIEQLPTAEKVLDSMNQYRNQISRVFHFEPLYESFSEETLLGLLRKRYIQCNDYNCDLKSLIDSKEDVQILRYELDLMGLNPLNPTCLLEWEWS